MTKEAALEFDGWTVNPVSGEIMRDGKLSRLPRQPLRILSELCQSPGTVVTREHLVKVLWPDGVVDFDNGLNVAIRKLRVALGDVGDTPKYIETLPRVGYRFVGTVGPPSASAVAANRGLPGRARLALGLTLAVLGIAVAAGWWWPEGVGHTRTLSHVPSVRARELYLDGLHQRSRRDISILSARALGQERFEAALREDPEYAQAWAALAGSLSVAVHTKVVPPSEGVPRARAAAQRAVSLGGNVAEGHIALGEIYLKHDRDFLAAKREIDRAMQLDDHSSRAWQQLGMWHADMGHIDAALEALRRARELEPMALQWPSNYARLLYSARRYEDVIEFLQPLLAANPKLDPAHSVLAWALIATGDLQGAEQQLRLVTVPTINSSDQGYLYAKLGRRDDALREVERLEALGRAGYGVAYDETIIYAALGELDLGCKTLARAVTEHSVLLGWMRLDPRLDPLRDRQCFGDVERRVYPSD